MSRDYEGSFLNIINYKEYIPIYIYLALLPPYINIEKTNNLRKQYPHPLIHPLVDVSIRFDSIVSTAVFHQQGKKGAGQPNLNSRKNKIVWKKEVG